MVRSAALTVAEYLDALPSDRRAAIKAVRTMIRRHLPKGYVETMNWGMICYEVPLSRYPQTYNKQPLALAALASQKGYCALYFSGAYNDPATTAALRNAFAAAGKKLDMGKSCIRFKAADDLPLAAIGKLMAGISPADLIASYERSRAGPKRPSRS